MLDKGIHLIVSEYNLLWEALKHYEGRLGKLASMSIDANQQLKYDEKRQDIEGVLHSIKTAAKNDYGLNLK